MDTLTLIANADTSRDAGVPVSLLVPASSAYLLYSLGGLSLMGRKSLLLVRDLKRVRVV